MLHLSPGTFIAVLFLSFLFNGIKTLTLYLFIVIVTTHSKIVGLTDNASHSDD